MAPLTWRNVNAPDFNSAARILDQAGQRIESGFGNIAGTLQDARERQRQAASAEAIGILAGVKGEADVDAALAAVLNGTASRNMTPELVQAIANTQGHALKLDSQRVQNRGTEANIRNTDSLIADRLHQQGIEDGNLALAQSQDRRLWGQDARNAVTWERGIRKEDAQYALGSQLAALQQSGGRLSDTQRAAYSNPNAAVVREGLIARGMPAHIADAFVINFQDESGLDSGINEANPLVEGSRGGFGLAQWTGPRRRQLEAFAEAQGKPVSDINVQLDFLMQELQGSESRAGQAILGSADTASAAQAIVNQFLRPAGEHRARRSAAYGSAATLPGSDDRIDAFMSQVSQAGFVTPEQVMSLRGQATTITDDMDARLNTALQERQTLQNREIIDGLIPQLATQSIEHAREDLTRRIRGMEGLTAQQKDTLLADGLARIEAEQDRWSAGTNTDTFDTMAGMEGLVDPSLGAEGALAVGGASVLRDNLANIDQAASIMPQYDRDVGALFGEGAVGTQVSQAQVLKFFEDSFNSDELYRADLDSMADSLLQISADTGVPMQYLAQHAMNAIGNRHNYNQQLTIDEDALRGQIGHLLGENGRFDQNKLFDVMTRSREMSQIQEDAQALMAKRALLEEHAQTLLKNEGHQVTDANRGDIQQLMREMIAISSEIQNLSERARTSTGVKTEAQAAEEAEAARRQAQFDEIAVLPPAPRDPELIQPTDRLAQSQATGSAASNAWQRALGYPAAAGHAVLGGVADGAALVTSLLGMHETSAREERRSDAQYNAARLLMSEGMRGRRLAGQNGMGSLELQDLDFEPGQYSPELVQARREEKMVSLAKSGVYSVAQLAEALGISLAEAQQRVSAR